MGMKDEGAVTFARKRAFDLRRRRRPGEQVMAAVQMHGQALNGDWRMEEVEQVWWWLRRTNVAYTTTHSTAGGRAW